MAAIDDIKSGLDINQLASMLGTDPGTANQAVDQALGSLLGAMGDNVGDENSALGLARAALGDHSTNLLDGGVDLGAIDTADGNAILSHVYSPQQIQTLSGAQGGLLQKLLPLLAPIVMAYIAKQLNGAMSGGRGTQTQSGGGSILDDILGSVLGGQAPQQPQQRPSSTSSGSIFGDILGSVFGSDAPEAAPAPAPAPQQRAPQAPSGPFPSSGGNGGLTMDDGSGQPSASYPSGGSQVASGGLGDLLRQILVGR